MCAAAPSESWASGCSQDSGHGQGQDSGQGQGSDHGQGQGQGVQLPSALLSQSPLEPFQPTSSSLRHTLHEGIRGNTLVLWMAVLDDTDMRVLGMQRVTVSSTTGHVLHRDPPLYNHDRLG